MGAAEEGARALSLAVTGTVLLDAPAPDLVHVTGADRVTLLHRLLTNAVQGLAAGQGRRALLLSVRGQVVADLSVLVQDDSVLLLTDAGRAAELASTLARFAVMDDFAARPDPRTGLGIWGPGAAAALATVDFILPEGLGDGPDLAHAVVAWSGASFVAVRASGLGTRGLWCFGEGGAVAELGARLRASGIATLSASERERLRVAAGEARYGHEYGPGAAGERFPMELGLGSAIDYGKGCYLGQEPIVRIRDRGHVNWAVVRLRLPAGAQVAPGDRLSAVSREDAGKVTSVAVAPAPGSHPGGLIALGFVHTKVAAAEPLTVHTAAGAYPAERVPAAEVLA